jgi:hypothetical protein
MLLIKAKGSDLLPFANCPIRNYRLITGRLFTEGIRLV